MEPDPKPGEKWRHELGGGTAKVHSVEYRPNKESPRESFVHLEGRGRTIRVPMDAFLTDFERVEASDGA